MLRNSLLSAEKKQRVIWRKRLSSGETHAKLNRALRDAGAIPLHPELTHTDNEFLKTAIERVNRNGRTRVQVIAG